MLSSREDGVPATAVTAPHEEQLTVIRTIAPFRRAAGAPALAGLVLAAALAVSSGAPAAADGDNAPPPGSSPVCAFYDGDGTTVFGEQGERVSQVQCMLANRRYLPWEAVDGVFGTRTLAAVQRFQADHPPLVPDGLVGPRTWSALWHA
ncbi:MULTISPECIES: peptidoglycan-binding protein [unclassified Streptomyces]|uniref:peptidoglycan-binding domain-containing protein n=1 Tax=unclassified Streptomyces TaxID=2593676 RepID=UPI00225B13C9|nr:peptidoglycan-binding domain-containing protein [Streptomyces sp. NBC_00338]MCX5140352.1 peptidoglycan-binding protein [Streptomyces sp. NBC_00338]